MSYSIPFPFQSKNKKKRESQLDYLFIFIFFFFLVFPLRIGRTKGNCAEPIVGPSISYHQRDREPNGLATCPSTKDVKLIRYVSISSTIIGYIRKEKGAFVVSLFFLLVHRQDVRLYLLFVWGMTLALVADCTAAVECWHGHQRLDYIASWARLCVRTNRHDSMSHMEFVNNSI